MRLGNKVALITGGYGGMGVRLCRLGDPMQCHPPGWIETDLTVSMSSNPLMMRMQKSAMNNTVLLRRGAKAEEIGYTGSFLASDESSYITGTDIVVDGGWFSSAPYLANERSHHMLSILDKKERLEEMIHRFH
jgi:NAD(P)-dependent dehydrogenase (short-subunit alcohol dehydrogenase family)